MSGRSPSFRDGPPWRVGTVPYLVARPLTWGLADHPQVDLVEAPPAQLARLLREGSLDIALASSVLTLQEDPLDLWKQGPVIACDGPIRSVLLFLRPGLTAPEQVRTWAADPDSRTGQKLTRWLLRFAWGQPEAKAVDLTGPVDPFTLEVDAVQLIGDPAMDAVERHPEWTVVDLGAAWCAKTRLPFLFAGWLCRPGFPRAALEPILRQAADRGLPQRAALAELAAAGDLAQAQFLRRYLLEDLHYSLPIEAMEGCLSLLGRAD